MQEIIQTCNLPLELMAGAGINSKNVAQMAVESNVGWVHGSFSQKCTFRNQIFDLGIKFETDEDEVKLAIFNLQK
jgi:copper homeostasis protein CutC